MGSCQGVKGVAGSVSHSLLSPSVSPQHGAGLCSLPAPVLTATVPLARAAGAVCEQHSRAAPALPVPLRALRQNLHRLLPGQGSLLHLGQQGLRPTPAHREEVSVCPALPCKVMLIRAGKGKRQPRSFIHQPDPLSATHPFLILLLEALPQRRPAAWGGTATALSALPQACPLPGRAES